MTALFVDAALLALPIAALAAVILEVLAVDPKMVGEIAADAEAFARAPAPGFPAPEAPAIAVAGLAPAAA